MKPTEPTSPTGAQIRDALDRDERERRDHSPQPCMTCGALVHWQLVELHERWHAQ